jgi:hypothetical protein
MTLIPEDTQWVTRDLPGAMSRFPITEYFLKPPKMSIWLEEALKQF